MSMTKSEKDVRIDSLKGNTSTLPKLTNNVSPTNARRRSSIGNRRNSDPALSSQIVGKLTTPAPEAKHLKILIIEDSLSILKVVTQMLRQKGEEDDEYLSHCTFLSIHVQPPTFLRKCTAAVVR